jgi:hypothetical protein
LDRVALVRLYRLAPGVLDALKIIKPQTVIRLASSCLSRLLALEITASRWTPQGTGERQALSPNMAEN